jgi:hypothetical protein
MGELLKLGFEAARSPVPKYTIPRARSTVVNMEDFLRDLAEAAILVDYARGTCILAQYGRR